MMPNRFLRPIFLLAGLGLLASCGSDQDDLDAYIASVKARTSTAVDPIPQVMIYEPFLYTQTGARDPFAPFASAFADNSPIESTSPLQPDFNRNREPLEQFPLGGLRMRGTLVFREQRYAVVESPDGVVHKVQAGNYLGQNFGKIVLISDAEIVLEEIVPDGLGGYMKRDATVALSGEDS